MLFDKDLTTPSCSSCVHCDTIYYGNRNYNDEPIYSRFCYWTVDRKINKTPDEIFDAKRGQCKVWAHFDGKGVTE